MINSYDIVLFEVLSNIIQLFFRHYLLYNVQKVVSTKRFYDTIRHMLRPEIKSFFVCSPNCLFDCIYQFFVQEIQIQVSNGSKIVLYDVDWGEFSQFFKIVFKNTSQFNQRWSWIDIFKSKLPNMMMQVCSL